MNEPTPTPPVIGAVPAPESGPQVKYAGFNRRMMAATVDSILVMILLAPLIDAALLAAYGPMPLSADDFAAKTAEIADPEQARLAAVELLRQSGMVGHWLQNAFWQWATLSAATGICWFFWAATPGKWLLRLRIEDEKTGAPISEKQIYLRLLGYVVSAVPLFAGFFWISFNKRRQGWHDKLAGTVVVVRPKK